MSVTVIIVIIAIISSAGNRTEWDTIQGVIVWVIWIYEHDYPWIVRHEVLLPINFVSIKMREPSKSVVWKKAVKI